MAATNVASHLNKSSNEKSVRSVRKSNASPIWMETDNNNRVHFIWHCVACDYRFQSMAVYEQELERIAA